MGKSEPFMAVSCIYFRKKNTEAGAMSRIFRNASEWKLFDMVTQKLGRPITVMSGSFSNK